MSKTKNKSDNKTEKALAAEKEQFGKQQVSKWDFMMAELNCEVILKNGFLTRSNVIVKFVYVMPSMTILFWTTSYIECEAKTNTEIHVC